jgi:hypothetical protein
MDRFWDHGMRNQREHRAAREKIAIGECGLPIKILPAAAASTPARRTVDQRPKIFKIHKDTLFTEFCAQSIVQTPRDGRGVLAPI